ncbi:MAG: pyrroline-5-carboxylate reductase [Rhodospirillaceae bacterium]|nr:pyrroline-5-carboxylate reductase [Rhodospirillaceae bacterium]
MIEGAILLVGCGKMGSALLEGWLKHGLNPVDVIIVEPAGRASIPCCAKHPALTVLARAADVPADFRPDVIVFAVKPQVADAVVPDYRRFARDKPLFLSIAAGKTIAFFKAKLGAMAAVVRGMPSTPAAIGKGISVLVASREADGVQRKVCDVLMAAAGQVAWIEDETLMDAVTALSGSGPAYVFLLTEYLAQAGVAAGLPADLAATLARATVTGSGALMEQSPESAGTLREAVTSKGGTTAAALSILMAEGGLRPLLEKAIRAATERSRELSSGN